MNGRLPPERKHKLEVKGEETKGQTNWKHTSFSYRRHLRSEDAVQEELSLQVRQHVKRPWLIAELALHKDRVFLTVGWLQHQTAVGPGSDQELDKLLHHGGGVERCWCNP